jgi:5-hydroxyisourate hydrolase-like protein (transthyretin family)
VHGSAATRFRYVVTNTVRDGELAAGMWNTGGLPAGDYTLRIAAHDYSGNAAVSGHDLELRLE